MLIDPSLRSTISTYMHRTKLSQFILIQRERTNNMHIIRIVKKWYLSKQSNRLASQECFIYVVEREIFFIQQLFACDIRSINHDYLNLTNKDNIHGNNLLGRISCALRIWRAAIKNSLRIFVTEGGQLTNKFIMPWTRLTECSSTKS